MTTPPRMTAMLNRMDVNKPDCGSIANLFVRFMRLMDQAIADELFGFGTLVVIGIGGLAVLLHSLIKNWNPPPSAEPNCADGGTALWRCCPQHCRRQMSILYITGQ